MIEAQRTRARRTLFDVLRLPTAPFREQGVIAYIRAWCERVGLGFRQDKAGNVLVGQAPGRAEPPAWVFAAHMDHPGFTVTRRRGRCVWARFQGGVGAEYGLGERVRLFVPEGEVLATVRSRRDRPRLGGWTCRLELDALARVPRGTIGMWDFPGVRVRGARLAGRACDDLAGVACVLGALEHLAGLGAGAGAMGLLTRAEEVGALGAAHACRRGVIPKGAVVIGLETSKAQPGARLGDGTVIRVGDRVRTFEPDVTAHMADVARQLARADPAFGYVRQFMPGGMCESTLYCAWGYAAGALCLPLGNYHNQGPRGRVAPERIDLGDYDSTVALLVELARLGRRPSDLNRTIRKRFKDRLATRGADLFE